MKSILFAYVLSFSEQNNADVHVFHLHAPTVPVRWKSIPEIVQWLSVVGSEMTDQNFGVGHSCSHDSHHMTMFSIPMPTWCPDIPHLFFFLKKTPSHESKS